MNSIQLHIGSKVRKFTAPSKWDELTKKQLLQWCSVLRMQLTSKEAMTLAVFLFYRIPHAILSQFNPAYDAQLRMTMDWLKQNDLTRNTLGYISIFLKKYHGPANRLSNLTISEFRRTELYYDIYQASGEKKYLHLLAATLFRPSGGESGNDMRCRLTEKGIIQRAKFYAWALHPNCLLAIKLFYEGCRAHIFKSHPSIYKPEVISMGKSRSRQIQDLEDHILAYSGGKLGNYNETAETNLYVFLKNMSQRIEEYERMKK